MTFPYYPGTKAVVYSRDCLEVLRTLPDASVDAVVTDPPYGLSKEPDIAEVLRHWLNGDDYVHNGNGFMGKSWDSFVPGPSVWRECLRVLKPGGHLQCFAGSRTQDLMGLAIRLAGFEIRDSIAWLHGQGFPKSLDVSKAIDKASGAEREVVGEHHRHGGGSASSDSMSGDIGTASILPLTAPATEAAQQWQGWGTALKPAFEPIVVGRKPFPGTVAGNVQEHGTGALNSDACRTATNDTLTGSGQPPLTHGGMNVRPFHAGHEAQPTIGNPSGRWPTNVVLDESQAAELDQQTGVLTSGYMKPETDRKTRQGDAYGQFAARTATETYGDSGGASRFFPVFRYQANTRQGTPES